MPIDPPLRPGERVALRAPHDILATLDAAGAFEGVPFMPEMLQYYGRAFTVASRVEKICDTICPVGSRRMGNAVFLEDLRCDGAAHGGCQAECRIYFKEAWLARLPPGADAPAPPEELPLAALARLAHAHVRQGDPALFRCQATEARRATTPLAVYDVRQYAREVRAGNVALGRMLGLALRIIWWELRNLARRPAGRLPRVRRAFGRPAPLGLQPGEWVEVRSPAEIARTLDPRHTNRGLYFSAPEMTPACGKRFRVRRRINRIIDEPTGKMLTLKNDCIVLDGPVCDGERSVGRWFCARQIYPYWREAWLMRAEAPAQSADANRPAA
jgi:hypothetical protein